MLGGVVVHENRGQFSNNVELYVAVLHQNICKVLILIMMKVAFFFWPILLF